MRTLSTSPRGGMSWGDFFGFDGGGMGGVHEPDGGGAGSRQAVVILLVILILFSFFG